LKFGKTTLNAYQLRLKGSIKMAEKKFKGEIKLDVRDSKPDWDPYIPSLYAEHIYFFSDMHVQNHGMEQASFISPHNSAIKLGLQPTNHSDFNVLPIEQMMLVWCAVNHTTCPNVLP
jgi:hypothetical protein